MYNTQLKLFTNNWAVNSGFEHLQKQLDEMLPVMGKVEKSQSANKQLEKFRKAQNLLYDLFNNALGNRRTEFRNFFGFVPLPGYGHQYSISRMRWEQIEDEMEPIFTDIILAAAKEQGIA